MFNFEILFAQNSSEVYTNALREFNNGNYIRANELFNQFFHDYKFNDELYASAKFYSSEAFYNINKLNEAIPGFEFLVNEFRYTNYRDKSLYRLGLIYNKLGDYHLSRDKLKTLINEYPKSEYYGSALYWIGENYADENNLEEAVNFFKDAISNKRNNTFIDYTIYALANTYEQMGDYKNAATYYDELLTYYRNSPLASSAQIRIGICYFKLGDYDSSILELSNPEIAELPIDKQSEVLYLLGNSYYRVGEYDNASNTYLNLIRNFPSTKILREVKYSLAWSLFQQKKYNEAFNIYDELSNGEDSIAINSFYWKGEVKRYLGLEDDALEIFQNFINTFPENKMNNLVQYQMGLIYYNKKNFNLANQYLLQATNTLDISVKAKAFTLLGEIELNKKNFPLALKYFQTVNSYKDNEIDDQLKLRSLLGQGIAYYYLNEYDKSISTLTLLSEKNPNFEHNKINFYIAESYFAEDKFSKALEYYNGISSDDKFIDNQAIYGKAYCYYNLKDYANASYHFQNFEDKYYYDDKIADVKIRLADSYFADKKINEAIALYQELLQQRERVQNKDYINYQYALALYRNNSASRAIDELTKLLENYPNSHYYSNALYLIGWIHFQQGDYYAAVENYRNLIYFAPRSNLVPIAYYSIGDAFYNIGQYDSAIVNYNIILNYYPNSSYVFDAINGIQYCYIAMNNFKKAVSIIDDFVLKNPNTSFADELFFKKGEIYYSQKLYEQAKNSYKEFIAYYPNSKFVASAYYWVGKSTQNLNQMDEAILNYRKIFNNYPTSDIAASAVIELGNIYIEQKKYKDAINLYSEASNKLKNSPRLAELKYMQGKTYLQMNDEASAYDIFEEVILYHDQNIFADKSRIKLGIIDLKAKRYENAQKYFQDLINKRTDDIGAEAQYYLGVLYFNQNITNDAITSFVRVVNVYSAFDEWVTKSYLKLGECYLKLGDKNKAREMYRTVITKHHGDSFGREAQSQLNKIR